MKTKVLFFLFTLVALAACDDSDDNYVKDEPEKPVSSHYSSIQSARFNSANFYGLVNDKKDIIGRILVLADIFTNNEITVNVVIDPKEFTQIPGRGTITDAIVSNKSESWEMRSVNHGRYAFRGGTAVIDMIDFDHIYVHLSFGPIVDDKGFIEKVDIKCKCQCDSFF